MDRKIEDRIAKLAFGELTEAEASQVRAEAATNTDAAQALNSYEGLRNDLRRLRDVPPDQLSKERLQNAILAQGLKPKPVRQGVSWLWAAPALTTAVIAIALLMKMPTPISDRVPGGGTHPDMMAVLNMDDRQKLEESLADFGRQIPGEGELPLSAAIESTSSPEVAASSGNGALRVARPAVHIRRSTRHAPAKMLALAGTARTMVVPAEVVDAPSEKRHDSLVLIRSERDGMTGANSAVEVQQTQDVIVSS
ncbi:MAG: hypothetical protein QOJ65_2025 [Fimbriimonadaceae bacterium]|jgi:hypothetical protein|nr:hypothetical protein [Fimbriimonadaceae bacterium]